MSHIGYWYITIHFIFFSHPTSIKWFVSWTVGNRLLKPLCGKMLDWLNFHLGEIIGLIQALEKRYYQNKTQLRYNFGSVYLSLLRFSSIAIELKVDRQRAQRQRQTEKRNCQTNENKRQKRYLTYIRGLTYIRSKQKHPISQKMKNFVFSDNFHQIIYIITTPSNHHLYPHPHPPPPLPPSTAPFTPYLLSLYPPLHPPARV